MRDRQIQMTATDEVRFYRANEKPYGCFSNLYRAPMIFEGREFPTAEHAYQFGKARKPEVRDWLMAAPSPSLLAMAAHGLLAWDIAPGWSAGRRARMRAIVEAKFRQHPDLALVLLGTGDARFHDGWTGQVRRMGEEMDREEPNGRGLVVLIAVNALRDAYAEIDRLNAEIDRLKEGGRR